MVKIGGPKHTAQLQRLSEVRTDKLPSLGRETPDVVVKDLFALGTKLSTDALKAVRQVALERFTVSHLTESLGEVGPALQRDLTNAEGGLSATLVLEQHARRLVALAPSAEALEVGAAALLDVAQRSAAYGDADRPVGDAWSSKEWPASGTALQRLARLLEARGLRPRELPLERDATKANGWWSNLPVQAPLFRNVNTDQDVEQVLSSVGHAPLESPFVDVDALAAIVA